MFRHCYGVKLTELHVDDWTIAKLLGHKGVTKCPVLPENEQSADWQMKQEKLEILCHRLYLASLDGWGEEYEQIRQDAGIE